MKSENIINIGAITMIGGAIIFASSLFVSGKMPPTSRVAIGLAVFASGFAIKEYGLKKDKIS